MRILLITILLFAGVCKGQDGGYFLLNQTTSAPAGPGYTPPSVTSGLVADYWADFGVTLDGFGTVEQWDDMSGLDHHLTQSIGAMRPAYATAFVNGRAVVDNNVSQYLATANFLSSASEVTVIWVVKIDAYPPPGMSTTGAPFNYNVASSGNNNHYPWTDGNVYHGNGTNSRKSYTPTTSLSTWHVFTHIAGANDWRDYIGATLQYSTTSNTFQANNTEITVGGLSDAFFMSGQIGRILVYNRKLTDGERGTLLSELNTYYGL